MVEFRVEGEAVGEVEEVLGELQLNALVVLDRLKNKVRNQLEFFINKKRLDVHLELERTRKEVDYLGQNRRAFLRLEDLLRAQELYGLVSLSLLGERN